MIDSTILAGLLGVGGSIAGTILGYKLNNTKADINVFIDNRVVLYYMENNFAMYVPITITNEGNKSATISDFKIKLKSPTNQTWDLFWYSFAEDNGHKNEPWCDGKRASPVLIHGNSGTQHHIKLIELGLTSEGLSNVILPAGGYTLELEYFNRDKKPMSKQEYSLNIGTEAHESLAKIRQDKEDLRTWIFGLERKN
ncbi:hypothetical protein [Shewanella sp. TC10]|uniref:hypothetical protein n=1 Tax=Shewanella sp. TC10 TaxID=1419739 RepID=UPI00129E10E2|nr:hypothetical protein [Shewanella sp. TC10]